MKLKKVEISAFRIYDKPENATFDLTGKSGNAAAFISLYAPNGFGKTSFYDAVEFAMTKSITRFYLRHKELEKLAEFQSEQNNIPFIKNSKSNEETYVKLYVDQSNEVIYSDLKKRTSQLYDLNFKKSVIHDFQSVVLSQEWISAFLTESNGETRYNKFMENPELSEINKYYNNLKNLTNAYQEKINKTETDINELKTKILTTYDSNLLNNINQKIHLLKDSYNEESLGIITLATTIENIKNFKDKISTRIVALDKESQLSTHLNHLKIARLGNNDLIGINTFLDMNASLIIHKQTRDETEGKIRNIQSLKEHKGNLNHIKTLYQDNQAEYKQIKHLKDSFGEYHQITHLIEDKESKLTLSQSKLIEQNTVIEEIRKQETTYKIHFDTALDKLSSLTSIVSRLPNIKSKLEANNIQLDELASQKEFLNEKKHKTQLTLHSIKHTILTINNTIEDINRSEYTNIESSDLVDIIQTLKHSESQLLVATEKQVSLAKIIDQQASLNKSVEDFIKTGMTLAKERAMSDCPLCNHSHNSLSELIEKITNNNALADSLKKLFLEQSETDNLISSLREKIRIDKDHIIKKYAKQLNDWIEKRKTTERELDDLSHDINANNLKLISNQKTKDAINTELEGLEYDKFALHINQKMEEARADRDKISKTLANKVNQLEEQNKLRSLMEQEIEFLRNEVAQLKLNDRYRDILNWHNEHYPGRAIEEAILNSKLDDLIKNRQQLSESRQQTESKVHELDAKISSYDEEHLNREILRLNNTISEAERKISDYRHFIKSTLNLNITNLSNEKLNVLLAEEEAKFALTLENLRKLVNEYRLLEKYSENILPFLQSENIKIKLTELEAIHNFLTVRIKPILEGELEETKQYLNTKVKGFFYEDLINELYNKIDPHPDFKRVNFKANFDNENPRLDVFVSDNKNETLLIPNLYFSTAQINILSLSIFLATALNSTKYQCIFIDDPIQSMDCINVLSTIDLLRSISVNQNKQIILSTHDKNFHNLLKKKMPSEIFESTFLELESFGRVKQK